jgi:ABC-2 type transport system ATP-binding protein
MLPHAIETKGLTKRYGATVGIEALDLSVEAGEVFGFLGPNGAGKTTTIRLLLDLIRPTAGESLVLGRRPGDLDARARTGYLPGELALDGGMTGRRTLEFLGRLRGAGRPPVDPRRRDDLCDRLGLAGADLDRAVRTYSRGTKQKLGLVAAFQHDPDVLILDEPTTALDPLVREAVFDLLAEAGRRGRTVFHSSHILSEVERTCARVAILRSGRLVALGKIEELRRASVRRMEVRFEGPVPAAELDLPGVRLLRCEGDRAALSVSGEIGPLLRALARNRVLDLSFPEPSLEDAFAAYYREGGADRP